MLAPETAEEALELINAAEIHFSKAFKVFEDDDDFYEGAFDRLIKVPEGFDLTIPTTGRAVVDEAVDNIVPLDTIVKYSPRGMTDKAERDADMVRRFIKGLWNHWRATGSDIDVMRDFAKNLFRSGKACWKLVPDWTLWPGIDEEEIKELKRGSNKAAQARIAEIKKLRTIHTPLILRSLPPQCFMEDPTVGSRKTWIVERYHADVSEVKAMYAKYEMDFREQSAWDRHTIHEVWTATRTDWKGKIIQGKHWIFIDKDESSVHEGENPYGDLPYIVKYSGFGRESYEGKPEFKSVGFYTPQVKSLLLAEARRFTQFDAIMAQMAFPIGMLPNEIDLDNFDTAPGAVNQVPMEVMQLADKIWLQAKIPDGEYLSSLQVLGGQIERATTQVPLRGAPVPGTDSAAQLGMYTGQAKLRLISCSQALEDACAQVSSKALRYIEEQFKDDVSVFVAEENTAKYTVGPGNIQGHTTVGVKFVANEDQMRERKLALASDAIAKGGLSPYDAFEYAGFDNPKELIARRLAYDVLQLPTVKEELGRQMLKEWGMDAHVLEMDRQKKLAEDQAVIDAYKASLMQPPPPPPMDPSMGTPPEMGPPTMGPGALPPGPIPDGMMPDAALAQMGMPPMPMDPGAPVMDPALMGGPAMQQVNFV